MNLPNFDPNTLQKGSKQELAALSDYLIVLNKTLKDQFSNIDEDNLTATFKQKIETATDTELQVVREDISTITQRCDSIELTVESTATDLQSNIDAVVTDVSSLKLTSDAINMKINNTKVEITETDGITVYNGGFRVRRGTAADYTTVFDVSTEGDVYYSGMLNTGSEGITLTNMSGVTNKIQCTTHTLNSVTESCLYFVSPWMVAQQNFESSTVYTGSLYLNSKLITQTTIKDYYGNTVNILSYS